MWTTAKGYPRRSCDQRCNMEIYPSYSIISFTAEQPKIQSKDYPYRNWRFWTIDHRPADTFPVKEWYLISISLQLRDKNATGFNWVPCLEMSNTHSPVFLRYAVAFWDSSSSSGCIRIQPMPSALQLFFKKFVSWGRSEITPDKRWCWPSTHEIKQLYPVYKPSWELVVNNRFVISGVGVSISIKNMAQIGYRN